MANGGLRLSTMVYEVLQWSTNVYDGLRRFTMVYKSLRWSTKIYDGLRRFTMVYEGSRWSTMVYDTIPIPDALRWLMRACVCSSMVAKRNFNIVYQGRHRPTYVEWHTHYTIWTAHDVLNVRLCNCNVLLICQSICSFDYCMPYIPFSTFQKHMQMLNVNLRGRSALLNQSIRSFDFCMP